MTLDDPNWFLMRSAVLAVGRPPMQIGGSLVDGDAQVHVLDPLTIDGTPAGSLAVAVVRLDRAPEVGPDGLEIPEEARHRAEELLEFFTRLVALEYRTTHSLSSPMPTIGITCSDPAALAALDGVMLSSDARNATVAGVGPAGILDAEPGLAQELLDRRDGVVLLTEALNAGSPLGQFTQLWRFFERAFKAGHGDSLELLVDFLATNPHGFDREEVEEWLTMRNPAIHANRAGRPTLDSDVQAHVPRMVEAAYDVLMNKQDWWKKSSDRRECWKPATGSSDRDAGLFVTQGKGAELRFQLFDQFVAYPMMLAGPVFTQLPVGLWAQPDGRSFLLQASVDGVQITFHSDLDGAAGLGAVRQGGPGVPDGHDRS